MNTLSSASDFSDAVSLEAGVQPGAGVGAQDPSGITAWTVTRSLTDGQTYYWRAKASDGTFEGAFLSGQLRVDAQAPEYPGDYNGDFAAFKKFFWACLERGVYLAPSPYETGFLSLAHSETDIDDTLEVFSEALGQV